MTDGCMLFARSWMQGHRADAASGKLEPVRGGQSPRLSTGCQPTVKASVNAFAMRCFSRQSVRVMPSCAVLLLPGEVGTGRCEPTE